MVEFSGTPEAGKSTTITSVAKMLEINRNKVLRLKKAEIDKGTFEANLWMYFITQAKIIKAKIQMWI